MSPKDDAHPAARAKLKQLAARRIEARLEEQLLGVKLHTARFTLFPRHLPRLLPDNFRIPPWHRLEKELGFIVGSPEWITAQEKIDREGFSEEALGAFHDALYGRGASKRFTGLEGEAYRLLRERRKAWLRLDEAIPAPESSPVEELRRHERELGAALAETERDLGRLVGRFLDEGPDAVSSLRKLETAIGRLYSRESECVVPDPNERHYHVHLLARLHIDLTKELEAALPATSSAMVEGSLVYPKRLLIAAYEASVDSDEVLGGNLNRSIAKLGLGSLP